MGWAASLCARYRVLAAHGICTALIGVAFIAAIPLEAAPAEDTAIITRGDAAVTAFSGTNASRSTASCRCARVRELLKSYLDQRVLFYETRDEHQLAQIEATTAKLQSELWSAVQGIAAAQPSPVVALALSGMNDVLNSEGYTQTAWWNRIPFAWALMASIAVSCSLLLGYDAPETDALLFLVCHSSWRFRSFSSPTSIPRGGVIRVLPHNLERLAHSLHAR